MGISLATLLILGPVEAIVDGAAVSFSRPQQRDLLGFFLLNPGRLLTSAQIIDAMWAAAPPQTAIAQVQNMVSAVRSALGDHGPIRRRRAGYLLEVDASLLDLTQFELLLRQAADAPEKASIPLLRKALGLWRGEPLADVHAPYVNAAAAELSERRLLAWETLFDAELATGDAATIVPELTSIVAAHPIRERLAGQLMIALHQCGRQADALDVFRRVRRHLAEEHGLDPGPALRDLERLILQPSRVLLRKPSHEPAIEDYLIAAAHAEKALGLQGIHPCGRFPYAEDRHPSHPEPHLWLIGQRALVLEAVHHLYESGEFEAACLLARMMTPVLESGGFLDEWPDFAAPALAAADAAGRPDWSAAIESGLGTMHHYRAQWSRSRFHLQRALDIWAGPEHRRNAGYAYLILAMTARAMGEPGTESMAQLALDAGVAENDVILEAEALRCLAWFDRDAGRPEWGCAPLRRAADRISTLDTGSDRLRGYLLHDLAIMASDLHWEVLTLCKLAEVQTGRMRWRMAFE